MITYSDILDTMEQAEKAITHNDGGIGGPEAAQVYSSGAIALALFHIGENIGRLANALEKLDKSW